MALPVILINSATGSDTAASGAGPSTALTGSSASTDVAGTTVTLDGSPDLSGVATDGSHVIYLADTTAGARNFGKITATDNSAKTVTVSDAFGSSLSGKTWAIGGKRASLLSTTSGKLIENNSSNGDAMPGWIMEMESGHTETRSSSITPRRSGDVTNGPITVRGAIGATTRPVLTFSNNGDSFSMRASNWCFEGFDMENSAGSKTNAIAFNVAVGGTLFALKNLRIGSSGNYYGGATRNNSLSTWQMVIEDCNIGYCSLDAIGVSANTAGPVKIRNCYIHHGSAHGINFSSTNVQSNTEITGNIIAYNSSDGIRFASTNAAYAFIVIRGNVLHGNGSDGIEVTGSTSQYGALGWMLIENNRFTYNGGYGINLSGASISDEFLAMVFFRCRNNAFYGSTSGKYAGMTVASSIDEQTDDPSGGLASSTKDYAGTTNGSNFMSSVHKGLGYPVGGTQPVGNGSSSYAYNDIGLQHEDAGGSAASLAIIRRGGTVMKM